MKSKSEQRKQAQHLFEQWSASLINRDRSKASLADNFDDLFYELDRHFVEFEIAYEFLNQAITAHLPTKSLVDMTYKNTRGRWSSKDEFYEDWKKLIRDAATNVFYSRYPLDSDKKKEESPLPGGMSRKEYVLQRKHADSFPALDLDQIPDIEEDTNPEEVAFSIDDLEGRNG